MKNWLKLLIIATLLIGGGAAFVWLSRTPESEKQAPKFTVAATIHPIADIARNIAGLHANVETVLPPGANPHSFAPTPREVVDLKDAKLILSVGQGVDNWAGTLASNLSGAKLVQLTQGIELIPGDEHYWLNAQNGKIIARNIANALIQADPEHKTDYESDLARYSKLLDEADQQIKSNFVGIKDNKIITHHNAWNYFARAYGLEVLGTIESSEGKEPTPGDLARLGKLAKDNGIKYIYIEPQLSEEVLTSFAKDNNLKITTIEGIGTGPYINTLLYNAGVIAATLK